MDKSFEDTVLAFAREIFESMYIVNEDVQREVVRMFIDSGDLFTVSDSKFNLESALSTIMGQDPLPDETATVSLAVGLSTGMRDLLTRFNPDMQLKFLDGPSMPHGLAYAQRIIDTSRCLLHVPHDILDLVDIGGNYLYYTPDRTYGYAVHCCNLVDGWRELHRQTQRIVSIESGKPATDFCTNGVQHCSHVAPWFISVHTLPCIDPALWVDIFKRHLFTGGSAVFHYDPLMDTADTEGYISEVAMHWVDVDGEVEFHFDNDSSLPYSHSRSWLRYYARPHIIYRDDWDYVIDYKVVAQSGGCIHATFTRLERATLGRVPSRTLLRWTGGENTITIPVPVFDESKGLTPSNPAAYGVQSIQVPAALYDHVFTKGFTNDTMRPDTPLSREDVFGFVRAFNYSLNVNGVALTVNTKLSSEMVDKCTNGIYLAVVYRAARARVMLGQITQQMMRVQRRWGSESMMTLVARKRKEAFYWAARTEMPADVRSAMEAELFEGQVPGTPVDPLDQERADCQDACVNDDSQSEVSVEDDEFDVDTVERLKDRDVWLERFESVKKRAPEWSFEDVVQVEQGTPAQVTAVLSDALLEFALYNLDVDMGVRAKSLEWLGKHFKGGECDAFAVQNDNILHDVSAEFLKVDSDGRIHGMHRNNARMQVVDPLKKVFFDVVRKGDAYFTVPPPLGFVYSISLLDIMNGVRISQRVISEVAKRSDFSGVTIELIDGIAGCGKTKKMTSDFTLQDYFVTGPKAPLEGVRKWLASRSRFEKSLQELTQRVRTTDSAICHSRRRAKVCYIDEGILQHAGALVMMAAITGARRVVVSGDTAQIRMIDRGSGFGTLNYKILKHWSVVTQVNITERCPQDVTYLIRQFFPEERRHLIKTKSPIKRSMVLQTIPDLTDDAYFSFPKFSHGITFTQGDKGVAISKPGLEDGKVFAAANRGDNHVVRPVLTAHESQGATVPFSIVLRLNQFTNSIFQSPSHQYVTISRHTIFSICRSPLGPNACPVAKLYAAAQALTDEQLDSVYEPSGDPDFDAERLALRDRVVKAVGLIV